MSTTNRAVKYGKIEIPDEAFQRKGAKIRISMMIDAELLDAIKARAKAEGEKYQPWIQKLLWDHVMDSSSESYRVLREYCETLDSRLAELERKKRA